MQELQEAIDRINRYIELQEKYLNAYYEKKMDLEAEEYEQSLKEDRLQKVA